MRGRFRAHGLSRRLLREAFFLQCFTPHLLPFSCALLPSGTTLRTYFSHPGHACPEVTALGPSSRSGTYMTPSTSPLSSFTLSATKLVPGAHQLPGSWHLCAFKWGLWLRQFCNSKECFQWWKDLDPIWCTYVQCQPWVLEMFLHIHLFFFK